MVYHSKATDGARLAEMVRLPKMFEKIGSIFLEVTRRFFCRIGRFSEDILFKQQSTFFRVYIGSSKHEEDWENSPNPPSVKMRLCKHGKSALLLL